MTTVYPRNADNPFHRNADGKVLNATKISELIRTSPDRAKQLCREAGEPVERWFPTNPK